MRSTLRTAFARIERTVSVVAVILAVFAGVMSTVTNIEVTDQRNQDAARVACQTAINQEFLSVIRTRGSIGNENVANLNDFVVAFINSKNNTPAQDQKVITTYLTELAKINGELAKATYPSIGDC